MNYRSVFLGLAVCFTLAIPGFAQQDVAPKEKVSSPRVLQIADADDWKRVGQFLLSPDGEWTAHTVMPAEGDGQLTIARRGGKKESGADSNDDRDTGDETKASSDEFVFDVGPGSGRIQFSHDSGFVAYTEAPRDKAAKKAKKSGTPLKSKVVLLNLQSGKKIEFKNTQTFSFSGENPKCLVVRKVKPSGRASGDKGWEGTDLLIHDLDSGTQINIGNVKSFAFNKSGQLLAMIVDAEGKSGNGVQLFHVEDRRIVSLENDKATYRSLSWTREGDALTFLKAQKDEEFENPHHQLIAFSDVGGVNQKKFGINPAEDSAIPDDMTISPNRNPGWNDRRTAVFFGIHDLKAREDASGKKKSESGESNDEKADSSPKGKSAGSGKDEAENAGLVIWHWQDPRLQSMQQKQESRDKNRFDLCVHLVSDSKTFRLGSPEIPDVSVNRPYKFALGTDNRKYERLGNLEGRRFTDVYTINLENGKRKLILEKVRYLYDISPNGVDLLFYQDDGHFYVYNMVKGTTKNITADVGVSFVNTEDDHNVSNPPRRPVGWTTSGDHVLLTDGWDIWKVSVEGGPGENLTLNGKSDQIRYSRPHRFDPDVEGVDLEQPVYISAYGEWTKKAGFGRLSPGEPGVKMLLWEDASFSALRKLEDHDVYSWSRSTHDEPTNFYVGGPDLKADQPMTDSNPQQKEFQWSAGVRLVEYTNEQGVRLQGALHLPADYIEGKKYPTIVYMYEKLSQNANRYDTPRVGGFSAAIYTSNGYAVFNPDIVFQINDPGMSSKDCILAGLEAAVETGVVDPDRVGLHGHSWGGYQTAFLITQTDKFKAAVAGAPLTNMISMYSSVYWNSGSANQPIFESSQGRFTGGYWENLEAYARNSPVYHAENVTTPLLLLHNDQDGAVDWNQGIEYFNTLRRLGKPIVMLQYTGENHGLRKPANRKDYSYRMLDFFNHHLKGDDAPQWWSDGIKHLDMKKHIENYRKKKTDGSDS